MKAENKSGNSGKKVGIVFFFVGFIIAMLVGWVGFPRLLYSEKAQPLNFLHSAHEDSSCEDCHSFRQDGTYTGIPRLENCKQCHESQMGDTEDERILVEEYIEPDKEIPWLVYAWQPDNVYFSHASHVASARMECVDCHRDVSIEEKNPKFYQNRLTGYSKNTMKMVACEKCHAEKGASNACQVCHK